MYPRNPFVSHSQQQGLPRRVFWPVEALLQNDCAGREGNFPALDQVTLTIVQGLEWQVVKCSMWHDYQLAIANLWFDRAQQSIVERTQVLLGAFRKSGEMISNSR